ncbi:MAG: hypothetical protein EON87_09815 [Brevundimonas sp.]|nr:MAG: hypothetical protein EON87_09815 [Brevundimonas sp.]
MTQRLLIDQKQNFAAAFGLIFRSAAVFWACDRAGATTTISFMNYWRIKRGLEVSVVITTRRMDGALLSRQAVDWADRAVVNHRVDLAGEDEGSIEVEVFSNRNLVIPYPAIMAMYETEDGLSMVHSYGRIYSPMEVENGKTIETGRESCFTLRDTATVRSFCVFHNGYEAQPAQTVRIRIVNAAGEVRRADLPVDDLRPYQTVRIEPASAFPDLAAFLGGRPGNAALEFTLARAFTRMLVGNETVDGRDRQVTHSNFDYGAHQTDLVDGAREAVMALAPMRDRARTVIVYPDSEPGDYRLELPDGVRPFRSGERIEVPAGGLETLVVSRADGPMPSRIVTAQGVEVRGGAGLPIECSLGVMHQGRPGKHSHWMMLSARPGHRSGLYGVAVETLYGPVRGGGTLSLHGAGSAEPVTIPLDSQAVAALLDGGDPLSLPQAVAFDPGGDWCWAYLNLDYPGWLVFSAIETEAGAATLEHAF